MSELAVRTGSKHDRPDGFNCRVPRGTLRCFPQDQLCDRCRSSDLIGAKTDDRTVSCLGDGVLRKNSVGSKTCAVRTFDCVILISWVACRPGQEEKVAPWACRGACASMGSGEGSLLFFEWVAGHCLFMCVFSSASVRAFFT